MLKLFYAFIVKGEYEIPESRLSVYRREKLLTQTNPRVRAQSVLSELLLSHALLYSGISDGGQLDLTVGEYGKPHLKSEECYFSLSHSNDIVFCALSDKEIGADVQIRSNAKQALINRCFCEDEQRYVEHSVDKDAAFTEIWTKKESRCKQDGRGLSMPLDSFSVFDDAIEPFLWHTVIGEYHFAVCTETVLVERPELIEVNLKNRAL